MSNDKAEDFVSRLTENIRKKELVRLILGSPRQSGSDLKNLIITPVQLKQGFRLQFVYRYLTKDITKNFDPEEGIGKIQDAIAHDFYHADLFTVTETIQFAVSSKGKKSLAVRMNERALEPVFHHDIKKKRLIETEGNIYLRELGILNSAFVLRREMSDKYLQINHYIELLQPHLDNLGKKSHLKVVDMGSGKGYLTFALCDFLKKKGIHAEITGVEQRPDLADHSNQIAGLTGFSNLKFIAGTIDIASVEPADILIALHACDTATDDAIFRGITWNSSLIVVAPCCHKQVRAAMSPEGVVKTVLKHGILAERQAEILTDSIRALVLEACGYKTSVIEFTEAVHTPRNVMIIGRKISSDLSNVKISFHLIEEILRTFGISKHYLVEKVKSQYL